MAIPLNIALPAVAATVPQLPCSLNSLTEFEVETADRTAIPYTTEGPINAPADIVAAVVAAATPLPTSQLAIAASVDVGCQTPAANLGRKHIAKAVIGKAIGLAGSAAIGSLDGTQVAVGISIQQIRSIRNTSLRDPARRIIGGIGDGSLGVSDRSGQAPHLGIRVPVAIGDRCPRSIGNGSQTVPVAAIGCGGLDGFSPGAGQGCGGHIAGTVIAHGLGDLSVGDGFQPVGIGGVVGIVEGAVAAGDGFDQIAAGVGVRVLVQAGGGDRNQLTFRIILHGLGNFPEQGDVVEVALVGVAFIGQGDPYLLHRFGGLLRDDAHAGNGFTAFPCPYSHLVLVEQC